MTPKTKARIRRNRERRATMQRYGRLLRGLRRAILAMIRDGFDLPDEVPIPPRPLPDDALPIVIYSMTA